MINQIFLDKNQFFMWICLTATRGVKKGSSDIWSDG